MKGLLFTYGLTLLGPVLALWRPWYGFLAYVTFGIIRPETLWHWSVPPWHYQRVIAVSLIAGWLLHGGGSWSTGRAKPIIAALWGYWIWIVVSAVSAPNQWVAWTFVEKFSKIILPMFIGFTLIESVGHLKQLAWVIVATLGFVAFEANLDHYSGGHRLLLNGYFGVDNNSATIALVTGAGIAFFLGLSETAIWRRWACFGCAAMLAHTPMIAESRGSMLGLISCGVVSAFLIPKTPRNLCLLGFALFIAISLAGPPVVERVSTMFADAEQRDSSATSRIALWGNCLDAMQRFPLTGLGPDHFPLAAKGYYGWDTNKESHSLWLNTGAELGVPGMLFLMSFYGFAVVRLWRLTRNRWIGQPFLSDIGRMVIASIAGFAVSAMFVALDALEVPFFITILGAGALKLADDNSAEPVMEPGGLGIRCRRAQPVYGAGRMRLITRNNDPED